MTLIRSFLCYVLILAASSASAQNFHESAIENAFSRLGEPHLYQADFPKCVLDFEAASGQMRETDMLLKATSSVDLTNGHFRGTWALLLPQGHEFGSGNYFVTVECGAGLGRMLVRPN